MCFPKINVKTRNTLSIILSSYVLCIWTNRENNENVKFKFKAKIIKEQNFHMIMLGDRQSETFTENYCGMNKDVLRNL